MFEAIDGIQTGEFGSQGFPGDKKAHLGKICYQGNQIYCPEHGYTYEKHFLKMIVQQTDYGKIRCIGDMIKVQIKIKHRQKLLVHLPGKGVQGK